MKKKIKFISCMLAALVSCAFVGCASESNAKNPSGAIEVVAENKDVLTNPVILLNGYEDHAQLSRIRMDGYLGKVTLNSEASYITEGDSSAKVVVIPTPWYQAGARVASLTQLTKIHSENLDFSDFSKTIRVGLDVYNTQDREIDFGVQLICNDYVSETVKWFKLAPIGWTNIAYNIESEFIQTSKVSGKQKTQVNKISFIFSEPADGNETYYIDNFCLYNSPTEIEKTPIELKTDEFCSYDEYWQFKKTVASCGVLSMTPKVSWIKVDGQENRNGVLRFETAAHPDSVTARQYPGIAFPAEIYKLSFGKEDPKEGEADWWTYDDNDELCFDIYVPEGNTLDTFTFTPRYSGTIINKLSGTLVGKYMYYRTLNTATGATNEGKDMVKFSEFEDIGGGWYTIHIPVSILNTPTGDGYYPNRVQLPDGTYDYEVMSPVNRKTYSLRNLTQVNLSFYSTKELSGQPQTLYFDNFRFVRVENTTENE